MGMSTHVIGFVPPDEKWKKIKAIYDACEAADIKMPDDVIDFFGGYPPDKNGQEIKIKEQEWSNKYSSGIEINLSDVPKHVKIIRFYNTW